MSEQEKRRNRRKKFISFYKPYKVVFLIDMFCALLAAGANLVNPLIVRYITNDLLANTELKWVSEMLIKLAAAMLLLALLQVACNYYITYLSLIHIYNLPVSLIPTFMHLTRESCEQIEKVALGLDIRSGEIEEVGPVLEQLRQEGFIFEILFMDCSTPVIVKRYKETRRVHPLSKGGRVDSGVEEERKKLRYLKKNANIIIDTSQLLIRDLKQQMDHIFVQNGDYQNFYITFVSFGFKYGIPTDADLVFDVRFLPNPFYIDELKHLTGNDEPCRISQLNKHRKRSGPGIYYFVVQCGEVCNSRK